MSHTSDHIGSIGAIWPGWSSRVSSRALRVWMQGLVWVAATGFLSPSQAVPQADLNEMITSVRVFPNLSFALPISLVQWPGDGERWLMAERGGQVFSFLNGDQVTDKQLVLDLTRRIGGAAFNESEQWGITGIALHTMPSMTPELPGEVVLFVAYNAKVTEGNSATSFVSRFLFLSPDDGQTFAAASERILFEVPQRSAQDEDAGIYKIVPKEP